MFLCGNSLLLHISADKIHRSGVRTAPLVVCMLTTTSSSTTHVRQVSVTSQRASRIVVARAVVPSHAVPTWLPTPHSRVCHRKLRLPTFAPTRCHRKVNMCSWTLVQWRSPLRSICGRDAISLTPPSPPSSFSRADGDFAWWRGRSTASCGQRRGGNASLQGT